MFIAISGNVDSSHRERRLTGDAAFFAMFKEMSSFEIDDQSVDEFDDGEIAARSGEVEGFFRQHLQLLLDPASTLPLHLDLGRFSCSCENGKFKIAQCLKLPVFGLLQFLQFLQQPGFRELTRDELMQLMRRLHAAPHAVLLNLYGHDFGEAVMQEMAAPMAALSKLQALILSCTCPPPPPYCILHTHVSITTAAATNSIPRTLCY